MNKPKVGKSLDDIFSRKQSKNSIAGDLDEDIGEPAIEEKQRRGRPQEHKEEWTKVTVVLLDRQIEWLDRLALEIRKNTKAAISRAELIRGLITAMEESGIDFSMLRSEKEVKEHLLKRFKGESVEE